MNMKAVCKLTGLNSNTLRAWERRYSAIQPTRTPAGHRLYSFRDVERLRLLSSLLKEGHGIRTLAALSDRQLQDLMNQAQTPGSVDETPPARTAAVRDQCLADLTQYDLRSLASHLSQARHHFSLRDFVLELVSPLLAAVGQQVHDGKINIAQEHALSAILRAQLGQIMQGMLATIPRERKNATFVFATPENELHEFGILLAALLCAYWGLEVCYLGPNLPAASLAEAATALSASHVVLGISSSTREIDKFLTTLDRSLGTHACDVLLGGPQQPKNTQKLKHDVRYLESLSALDSLFQSLAPQVYR